MTTDRWLDDSIQFPRLICEIVAATDYTDPLWEHVCDSMDIDGGQLDELFNRAEKAWEEILAARRREHKAEIDKGSPDGR